MSFADSDEQAISCLLAVMANIPTPAATIVAVTIGSRSAKVGPVNLVIKFIP